MNLFPAFCRTLNQTWPMRNRPRKPKNTSAIFPHGSAKQGIFRPLEIVRRLYLTPSFSETVLRAELPKLSPNKAIHSQARDGGGIQDSQGNPGLCSIRAIVISLPNDPATSLFSGAISSLESQLSFSERPSRRKTVMPTLQNAVFAYTQT